MADPLSLLRSYAIAQKPIEERDCNIIFGEFSWPKTVQTNFRIYGWENKDHGQWEYYTLDCLLYFLKNVNLSHPAYVKEAAREEVPVVRRPDRKELLAFLKGTDSQVPKSIDKSARLEMPTHVKRSAEDKLEITSAKKARLDVGQTTSQQELIKERLAAKLDASNDGKLSINRANLKNLSEDLTTDKIAEIRAKLISNRRTRIKPEDEDSKTTSLALSDLEVNREASNIFNRERQWRTRTTILQSAGKTFSKTVTAILASVKAREEGKMGKPGHPPTSMPRPGAIGPVIPGQGRPPVMPGAPNSGMLSQPRQLPNYNRYDQEQFTHQKDTHGFNIETTGTFSGMTLKSAFKSVAEGSSKPGAPNKPMGGPTMMPPPGRPTGGPVVNSGNAGSGNQNMKRPSRTPIIVIPGAAKSLITMLNAKDVLQDLRFISNEDKRTMMAGAKRDNELLIQRRKEGGLTVPYRVIDNPAKLTNADWDRVVAVFALGQAWQFKGWPWDGNPTVIFSKIAAFHVKWDDSILEKNIANWSVNIIQLSRNKRHLDRAKLMNFWEILDKYLVNNKPHLRF